MKVGDLVRSSGGYGLIIDITEDNHVLIYRGWNSRIPVMVRWRWSDGIKLMQELDFESR